MMYKNISACKNVDLFSSVFKKIIPDATIPSFYEVGKVTQTLIFFEGIKFSHGIAFPITK